MSLPGEHSFPPRTCQLLQVKRHLSELHTGGLWLFMSIRSIAWQAWQLRQLQNRVQRQVA